MFHLQAFRTVQNRSTLLTLLQQAWYTESFAWICTAELDRSWEQTNKTPCKTTRKPLNCEFEPGEGDDQQYLKCTNCSRSLCTTCTLSTLELQCLQHVEESKSLRWTEHQKPLDWYFVPINVKYSCSNSDRFIVLWLLMFWRSLKSGQNKSTSQKEQPGQSILNYITNYTRCTLAGGLQMKQRTEQFLHTLLSQALPAITTCTQRQPLQITKNDHYSNQKMHLFSKRDTQQSFILLKLN